MSYTSQEAPTSAQRRGIDRTWLLIYLAVGAIALLFLPLTAFPVMALLALGFIVVHSAVVHRQTGWMSGLLFGLMLLSPAILGIVVLIVRIVRG